METHELEKLFLEAYDKHSDEIFRHVFFRVHDRDRAKDLVQETFTRTWEYLRSGKEVEYIRAFLYRVANNLVIDHSRVSGRTTSLEMALEEGMQFGDETEVESHEFSADARMLVKYIDELEPMYREVIILRYLQDLSVKDIAHQLGEKETNVSVRIHRAIEKLRTLCHVESEEN